MKGGERDGGWEKEMIDSQISKTLYSRPIVTFLVKNICGIHIYRYMHKEIYPELEGGGEEDEEVDILIISRLDVS